MKKILNKFNLGGRLDALAIILILSPLLINTPFMRGHIQSAPILYLIPIKLVIYTLCISGFMLLLGRIHKSSIGRKFFDSGNFSFASSNAHQTFNKDQDILIGFTSDNATPIGLYFEIMTRHISIVGQSGTGKSVFNRSLLFQHALKGGGFLHIDGKNDEGDFLNLYAAMKSIGRENDVYLIDFDAPYDSNTYNPILHGDPDEVASRIVSLIPSSQNSPGSDHYRSEATVALTTLVAALQTAGLAYSMIDLSMLLMSDKALMELDMKLAEIDEYSEAIINYRTLLSKFTKKTKAKADPNNPDKKPQDLVKVDTTKLKEMFGGVGGRIFTLGTGNFGIVTNTYNPEVKLFDIITNNKILWVKLPTLAKAEAAQSFGKILVSDLRTAVSWVLKLPQDKKPNPLFIASMDEAGSYVNDNWGRLFEQARSARIVMMPAVQTHANYTNVSPELLSIVEGNTWNKVYFKVGDTDTAERICKSLGKTKTVKYTVTQSETSNSTRQNSHIINSNVGNNSGQNIGSQENEEDIISTAQLMNLGIGECILTVGGAFIYHLKLPVIKSELKDIKFIPNRYTKDNLSLGINLKSDYKKYIDIQSLNTIDNADAPKPSDKLEVEEEE